MEPESPPTETGKKTRRNSMRRLMAENAETGVYVPGMQEGLCQDVWNTGLKHYVNGWWRTPDGWKFVTRFFPVFVKKNPDTKKSFNCDVKNEGNQYVLATLPARDKLQAYLNSLPIWKDLRTMPDGLYTWIFYHRAASPVQFAATRTWSALEMGTTHLAIATRVGASAVHGAGELRKSGNVITYNLLSGTFTADWKKKMKGPCTSDAIEKYIEDEFLRRFSGLTLQKTDVTLIDPKLPVTQEEVDTYTKAGWTFRFFPTQEACLAVMNAKGGRRHTRRGGVLSEPQKKIRELQIKSVQDAREEEIQERARAMREAIAHKKRNPDWRKLPQNTMQGLNTLLTENDRLYAKGKGRRTRRRS